jgi:hypothetical protein
MSRGVIHCTSAAASGPVICDLTLAGHIPDLHMFAQVPVILFDRGLERLGQQHVIDHGKAAHAGLFDAVRIGRAADAPRHVQAIHQAEVHIE